MSADILDRLQAEAAETFGELPVTIRAADAVRIERLLLDAASEIRRGRADLNEVALNRITDSLPLGTAKDAIDKAVSINDLRCPLCGSDVEWRCWGGAGATATAHCQAGRLVSRVQRPDDKPCEWSGTKIARLGDGSVVALWPVSKARNPEVTA